MKQKKCRYLHKCDVTSNFNWLISVYYLLIKQNICSPLFENITDVLNYSSSFLRIECIPYRQPAVKLSPHCQSVCRPQVVNLVTHFPKRPGALSRFQTLHIYLPPASMLKPLCLSVSKEK